MCLRRFVLRLHFTKSKKNNHSIRDETPFQTGRGAKGGTNSFRLCAGGSIINRYTERRYSSSRVLFIFILIQVEPQNKEITVYCVSSRPSNSSEYCDEYKQNRLPFEI